MSDPIPNIIERIICLAGSLSAIFSRARGLFNRYFHSHPRRIKSVKAHHPLKISSFGIGLIDFSIIVIASTVFIIYTSRPSESKKSSSSNGSSETISPVIIVHTPLKGSVKDTWLDDMNSILPRERAFFIHSWNSYNPIEVGNTIYPHCIGVCIPKEAQEEYYEENSPDQQIHSEYIEYSLSNKYQTFEFDYGIDDCSFPDNVEEESLCEFNIVVQSCNSTEFLKEQDNILFDSGWINYRCGIHRAPEIDVSGCEALRITVTWRFFVRQDGPIAFNVVILNPILRVAKFNIDSTTKPDSIY